jgi:hypothetical protein
MFVGKQGLTAFYKKSRLPILLPAIYAAIFFINSTSDLKASSNISDEYQTKALPVLKKHCFPCHDSTVGAVKGNLDLARIQPEIIGKQQEDSWSLVLKKIQSPKWLQK